MIGRLWRLLFPDPPVVAGLRSRLERAELLRQAKARGEVRCELCGDSGWTLDGGLCICDDGHARYLESPEGRRMTDLMRRNRP